MKTSNPLTTPTRTTRSHPEVAGKPLRSGVLGTILTELEFGEDEQQALRDCAEELATEFDEMALHFADRAREVAIAAELHGVQALAPKKNMRASIRNLRRHAARQWLQATLDGQFDAAFSRQLRHTWMPILLAEPQHTRATGAAIAAFFDYVEGYVGSLLVGDVSDNLVPGWRQFHAFRTAIDVQRRVFGHASSTQAWRPAD
ncbi:MAG: hypothetical protein H6832_19025 [Planctomycetes bacterium]|nr:hypothetical protein [Planctomycetota bacterium]MCB9920504.1 hypothetical protein [Planctomycetota bacterium]